MRVLSFCLAGGNKRRQQEKKKKSRRKRGDLCARVDLSVATAAAGHDDDDDDDDAVGASSCAQELLKKRRGDPRFGDQSFGSFHLGLHRRGETHRPSLLLLILLLPRLSHPEKKGNCAAKRRVRGWLTSKPKSPSKLRFAPGSQ